MNKTILFFLLAISSVNAQMKISEIHPNETVGKYHVFGNNFAEITKGSSGYIFVYQDMMTDTYKSFGIPEADFENLYSVFSHFQEGQKKQIELESGDVLVLTYRKAFGKEFVDMLHIDKYGIDGNMKEISMKQIDKLFGKKK